MATAYGAYYAGAGYNAFRARIDYSTSSSTETSVSVSVTTYCNMGQGHDAGQNFTGSATVGSSTSSATGSTYFSAGGTYAMVSKSATITKTHSAQTVTVRGTVKSTVTWSGHSSSVSATISVPAKASYKVTYNANGGSGAPSEQTKWHGEALTLSTAKPTRTNYEFLRWNTKADGTGTNYSSGASYTGNAALTLYAVWKQAYVSPTISSLSAYRVNSNDVASDDGDYCHVSCTWAAGALSGSTILGDTLTIRYKLTTASSYTTANVVDLSESGASDTTDVMIAAGSAVQFDTDKSYNIQVTVADNSGQSGNTASRAVTLSPAYFTLDLRAGGHGMGIGHSADVEGVLRIGMDVQIDGYQETVGTNTYDRGNFACVDPRLPQNNAANVLENTWGNGLFFYPPTDFNTVTDNPIMKSHGYIRGINLSSGTRGVQVEAQRFVNGNRRTTPLNLTVDDLGNMRATLGGFGIFVTHGTVAQNTSISAKGYHEWTISFNHTYSTAPNVQLTIYTTTTAYTSFNCDIYLTNVTQTQFTARIVNRESAARSPGFHWFAIGN